jgi:hypothetical protein
MSRPVKWRITSADDSSFGSALADELQINEVSDWACDEPAEGGVAVAQALASRYFDTATDRTFSLRSRKTGMDVQAIAVMYGGGGHPNAAGFRAPLGWEGGAGSLAES